MTTSEIRALLDQSKEWRADNFDSPYFLPDIEHVIETLLAREAEVMRSLDKAYSICRDTNACVVLFDVRKNITAILEPENEHGN